MICPPGVREGLTLGRVRVWLIYHLSGNDFCLKTSPQDNRNQNAQIAFQLLKWPQPSLVLFSELSFTFTISKLEGILPLHAFSKNNSYWLCYSDFVNSLSFQTLLIWTHPVFKGPLTYFLSLLQLPFPSQVIPTCAHWLDLHVFKVASSPKINSSLFLSVKGAQIILWPFGF